MSRQNARRFGAFGVVALVALILGAFLLASSPAGGTGTPAEAQPEEEAPPVAVSMVSNKRIVPYGEQVKLTGAVENVDAGTPVALKDETGAIVRSTTTALDGTYAFALRPKVSKTLQAEVDGSSSDVIEVPVRSVVSSLGAVEFYGQGTVSGRVRPAPKERLTVTIYKDGTGFSHKKVPTDKRGRFAASFAVQEAGKYHAVVEVPAGDLLDSSARTKAVTPQMPALALGSSGTAVMELERRLAELSYYLTAVDNVYDEATADAVLAFHKVQGMEWTNTVHQGTWKALDDPFRIKARSQASGTHVEVDQTKQVMLTVEDGAVTNILHVSTGREGNTVDGTFSIYKKGGYGREYFPAYFDGRRAFHVWADVPTYAASAGCVRMPFWAAEWFYDAYLLIGTEVEIYH